LNKSEGKADQLLVVLRVLIDREPDIDRQRRLPEERPSSL